MATVIATPFELVGADGGPLRGEVRTAAKGEGRPAVVICHGFKGFMDWGFFPHLAARLARAGMISVSFNFSGSGVGPDGESFSEPERFGHNTFSKELADLEIISRSLVSGALSHGVAAPTKFGVFGHSRGGAAAILYTAGNRDVAGLVTWSSIAQTMKWDDGVLERWRAEGKIDIVNQRTGDVLPLYTDILDDLAEHGADKLDLLAAASRVTTPWLIVHGEVDESVEVDDAKRLFGASKGGAVELKLIPRGSHTYGARHPWCGSTAELDSAMDATVACFCRYLL